MTKALSKSRWTCCDLDFCLQEEAENHRAQFSCQANDSSTLRLGTSTFSIKGAEVAFIVTLAAGEQGSSELVRQQKLCTISELAGGILNFCLSAAAIISHVLSKSGYLLCRINRPALWF